MSRSAKDCIVGLLPHDVRRWWMRQRSAQLAMYHDSLRQSNGEQAYTVAPMLEKTALFVHIPKCAGVSFSNALFGYIGPGHLTLRNYEVLLTKKEYDSCFKFSIVRNPWDRLHSAYSFLMHGGIAENDHQFREDVLSKYTSFEQFVISGLSDSEVLKYYHFLPQEHYLRNYRGRIGVDYVGRFERLSDDFNVIANKLGLKCDLEHTNKTKHQLMTSYRDAYTVKMKERVRQVYGHDINLLGYKF